MHPAPTTTSGHFSLTIMTSLRVFVVVVAALLSVAMADKELSGGGVFMKVQGQSGKMTYATSTPVSSAADRVQVQLASLSELSSTGTVLGAGGAAKHSFNSFATQSFTFSNPTTSTYQGVRGVREGNGTKWVPHDYPVTTITFDSLLGAGQASDSKLAVVAIIFNEDAVLEFPNLRADGTADPTKPKLRLAVAKGTLKFNVEFSQWNWCDNNGCKNADGVGADIKLVINMETQAANANNTAGCSPCSNGAVSALGSGANLAVINSYDVVGSGGASTSYVLGVAPQVSSTTSGGTVTTTLTLVVPRTHFGATDRLVYDPIVSYGTMSDPEEPHDNGASRATLAAVTVALVCLLSVILA